MAKRSVPSGAAAMRRLARPRSASSQAKRAGTKTTPEIESTCSAWATRWIMRKQTSKPSPARLG
jgi:hypothetical protein